MTEQNQGQQVIEQIARKLDEQWDCAMWQAMGSPEVRGPGYSARQAETGMRDVLQFRGSATAGLSAMDILGLY